MQQSGFSGGKEIWDLRFKNYYKNTLYCVNKTKTAARLIVFAFPLETTKNKKSNLYQIFEQRVDLSVFSGRLRWHRSIVNYKVFHI